MIKIKAAILVLVLIVIIAIGGGRAPATTAQPGSEPNYSQTVAPWQHQQITNHK